MRPSFDLLGCFGLQAGHNLLHKPPVIINPLPDADIPPDLLGKKDFITPSQHLRDRSRQSPLFKPKIDNVDVLIGEPADFDDLIERRVADQSAVPIVLSLYRGPRETRRQASARQDVFGRDFVDVTIEDRKLRRLHVHCR